MLHFENDYNEGMHPALLEALAATNDSNQAGYGSDDFTKSAADKIRSACQAPDAEIFFLTGGTQTNQIAIASLLRPYEGVVATDAGHISTHEAGAIEHAGHKVLTLPHQEGKLTADAVADLLVTYQADGNREHMVRPGIVYISHPTEYGTLYTKEELTTLSDLCRRYNIPLFLDGARLGYGLLETSDVDLPTIAELCDAFYIGGTKLGAIAGEALVFTKNNQPAHFLSLVKQKGALLAKGRLYGVQFDRFFTDDLYLTIGRQAIALADQIRSALTQKGYRFYIDSPTNQIFIIIENSKLEELGKQVVYSFWEKYDDNHTVIRLCTSWSTTQEEVEKLVEVL